MPTIQISKATTHTLATRDQLRTSIRVRNLATFNYVEIPVRVDREIVEPSQAATAKDCSEFGCQSIVGTGPMASRTIPAPQRAPHMWTDRHKAQASLILTPNLSSITFQIQVTMQTKLTLLLPRLKTYLHSASPCRDIQ